ncbi:hypothetical protein CK203_062999 [Vitis vinifera]|uniref:Uncharacterized protein n=1 Tax=Vitis vinifera TaxID=29760 RepID=A0A438G967_VITVI|nr:hypothetical protein CK203_062999 [Vitis vinifera]
MGGGGDFTVTLTKKEVVEAMLPMQEHCLLSLSEGGKPHVSRCEIMGGGGDFTVTLTKKEVVEAMLPMQEHCLLSLSESGKPHVSRCDNVDSSGPLVYFFSCCFLERMPYSSFSPSISVT